MAKNPFKAMAEIYDNQVKEADKKNTADLYLKATEYFIEYIEDCSYKYYNAHSLCDIEYLDGYFIFGYGTNSVIHFHVKECPNWIFAIWWNKEETKGNKKKKKETIINGEFFCQYEPALDKFKPSRSSYNSTFKVRFDADGNLDKDFTYLSDISRTLDYIQKNPIMAWGHDYCGYDYNYEYVSKFKVTTKYIRYRFREFKKNLIIPILDKNLINYTKKLSMKEFENEIKNLGWKVDIQDSGIDTSPRYELTVEFPDGFDKDYQDTGCYSIFEEDSINDKKWKKREKILNTISDFFEVYWYRAIDNSVTFWNQTELDEYWKEQSDTEEILED